MRRAALAVAAVFISVAVSGCGPYLFRQSDRVQIATPADHATVPEPVTVTWDVKDFAAPRDGSYAVFIDRDPMPPGESLAYFDPHDRDGIHVLTATSLRLPVLGRLAGVDPAEQDHHDVTVVLLDQQGRRIGEYAAYAEFTVDRGGT